MNKDIIPFLMDAMRLNPAGDLGATMAELVRGKGSKASALAFLPFLGWAKKAKKGADLVSKAAKVTHAPAELTGSALKAAERKWAEGLGGALRPAPPLPLARRAAHEVGELSVPFFQQYNQQTASAARKADEMFRNMERLYPK